MWFFLSNFHELFGIENDEEIDMMYIISKVRCLRNELFEVYVVVPTSGEGNSSTISPSSSQPLKWGQRLLMDRGKKPRGSSSHLELGHYLTTVFEFDDDSSFELVEWWRRYKTTFPTWVAIAKQLLAVPASTVVIEQTFNSGGNIIDERRSRLTPEKLEA